MAVSGKTAAPYEFPYLKEEDIPDMGAGDKAIADALQATQWLSQSLKPTLGLKTSTAVLSLTTAYQDVPGVSATITPVVESNLVVVTIPFLTDVGSTTNGVTSISVDGSMQDRLAILGDIVSTTELEATVAQIYLVKLAAGAHTIKLRGKKNGAGSATCQIGSTMFYALFAA